MASVQPARFTPELSFLAAVALRFEAPRSVGETPDGVRFHFTVQGTVDGPRLKGHFPPCAAYLLVDREGIGTINVRAPLLIHDGATAELEATGRYDFGADGYRRAAAGDLPNSALGWCPRLTTAHPNYLWLNRTLHIGVGELRPRETRVDYDLFTINAPVINELPYASPAPASAARGAYDKHSTSVGYPSPPYPSPPYPSPPYPSPTTSPLTPAPAPSASADPTSSHGPTSYEASTYSTPSYGTTSPGEHRDDQASLYERLGGQAGIDGIARDFVDALLGNVNLNRQNRKVAVAHSTVRGEKKRRAVQLASDMFCKLTGGPCEHKLTRPLRDTHVHLDITESDWALMRVDLDRVLTKHHVAKRERDELMAIVEGTKKEIVK